MTTNVPMPSFGDAGFTSPNELDVLAGVLADWNAAFGGNLNTGLSTPQGQLATSFSAVIGAFNDFFVDYTNQVDPAFASGRMQDAIARIYYLTRNPARATVVTAVCSGATGVTIPAGSLAKASDGSIYSSLSSVTIPASGNASAQFANLVRGPIACPAGSLNTIYRQVAGWDSVTNPADGLIGEDEESRVDFEERRAASVANNATGILPAIRGVVLGVQGVADAFVTENPAATAATIGGKSIAAHSLYVCVEGGTDAAVAAAIWSKKNPGCGYVGNTTVAVLDTNSGYLVPPSYNVTFQRPASVACNFAVSIANGASVPSNAVDLITAALSAQFQKVAKIGMPVFASSFVCPVAALGDWARILTLTVNASNEQVINIDQFPAFGTVTVTLV
jgi:uncharacterized phage protein gp47/JayE